MDIKRIFEKIEREKSISDAEWDALEKQSDPKKLEMISQYVRSIYQEQPSPSWQACLYERLDQTKKRSHRTLHLKHALSIATAGVIALSLWLIDQSGRTAISSHDLAHQLTQWHEEAKAVTFLPPDSMDLASLPQEISSHPDPLDELVFGDYLKEL
ncbi:MAG: hypothetical protein QXI19_14135 [Candidatus Caldarchaeum sp.]